MANWKVPYEPGTLKAVGYSGEKQVAVAELQSAGEAVKIKLTADRNRIGSDGQDLSYVTVEISDNKGVRNPRSENLVLFELVGPGTIVGVANANPTSLESFQLPRRKAWHGKCMVVIKSESTPGSITLKASSEGLIPASIKIESN
jgi:beta-galactosidase